MPSARRATVPADLGPADLGPADPGPAELAPAVFTTAGLAAPRRVELWEAHNAAALIGLFVPALDYGTQLRIKGSAVPFSSR